MGAAAPPSNMNMGASTRDWLAQGVQEQFGCRVVRLLSTPYQIPNHGYSLPQKYTAVDTGRGPNGGKIALVLLMECVCSKLSLADFSDRVKFS